MLPGSVANTPDGSNVPEPTDIFMRTDGGLSSGLWNIYKSKKKIRIRKKNENKSIYTFFM